MAGPYNSSVCIHFIILCHISNEATNPINVDLDDSLLEILSTNNIDVGDEMSKLQNLAKEYYFNPYICIIDQNEKKIDYLNTIFVQNNEQWSYACLVYDKQNRLFYPFFIRDNNKKYRTTFPMNDTHPLQSFEDLVACTWPSYFQTIQQSSIDQQNDEKENALTNNVNHDASTYNI